MVASDRGDVLVACGVDSNERGSNGSSCLHSCRRCEEKKHVYNLVKKSGGTSAPWGLCGVDWHSVCAGVVGFRGAVLICRISCESRLSGRRKMVCVLKIVVVVLATSSSFVAEGMEPLAGPLVTQTVMQAGGASRCFVCSFLCLVDILPCLRIIRDDDLRIVSFSQSRSQ